MAGVAVVQGQSPGEGGTMADEVKLPRLGQGMESGTIVKWLKSEGDEVEKGEPLYELDTDKVTQEVEADFSGVLLKIAVEEGEVPVGETIAVIGKEGEEVPDAVEVPEDEEEEGSPGAAREADRERGRAAAARDDGDQPPTAPPPDVPPTTGRLKASPLARRIARERGIDLSGLTGTGPEGRVVAEDVERARAAPSAAAAPADVEVEVEKLSSRRRTIARRLTEAWQAPVFQLGITADMTQALALREQLLERQPEGAARPTVSDVLTKLCAVALVRHRAVNAHFVEDEIRRFPSAAIGLAVAAERGLVVPVIPACETKSIAEIAAARADLVERARSGKLQQSDLEGGTFTISNLGMYGVESFVAVLNPPQAAIVAVGSIEERPAVENGELVARPTMELTLTCDHRAVDGAPAAEFLRALKAFLEQPGLAL
jgi:pyruvate dehydrogenase E2 component (dihydrolipoyllysine-residue acetyltransferase)